MVRNSQSSQETLPGLHGRSTREQSGGCPFRELRAPAHLEEQAEERRITFGRLAAP
jgi:hypothetical protein